MDAQAPVPPTLAAVRLLIASGVDPVVAERTIFCGRALERELSGLGLTLDAGVVDLLASVVLEAGYLYDLQLQRRQTATPAEVA